jgi:serine phosphatase RsbU (regulator of sigma subunit)
MAVRRRAPTDQQTIKGRLQQAILPAPLSASEVNGMRLAVRCMGADRAVQVGGDWYLTAALPDGDLMLAVGDVGGHGLSATPSMVLLRHAMEAFAIEGREPSEILSGLNSLLCKQASGTLATAVVACYHPVTGQLTWARAGHPPILRAGHDGVEPLSQPAGTALGVLPDGSYGSATTKLDAGDVVLMYTDGFVERPGTSIDDGVRALGDQVRHTLHGGSTHRPSDIVDRLRRRNPHDDACALAAESLPPEAFTRTG